MWVGIITGLLKLVSALAGIFATRQLLDAGEAKAIAAGAQRTLNAISKAQTIRRRRTTADDDLGEL